MPKYGEFETLRQRSSSHHATVWSARRANESPAERFLIKVLEVSSETADYSGLDASEFIERATLQQQAAMQSRYWARVHAFDRSASEAYYVTDNYPLTLRALLDGRVHLSARAIHDVLSSVLRGLIDLRDKCNHTHGQLNASNILIVGRRISSSTVVLSEPSAGRLASVPSHLRDDMRAVGDLLYYMVCYPRSTPAFMPIESTDPWKIFGKRAPQWLTLCNLMLGALSAESVSLETALHELNKLHGAILPHAKLVGTIAAAAACAVLAIGWALSGNEGKAEPQPVPTPFTQDDELDRVAKSLQEIDNLLVKCWKNLARSPAPEETAQLVKLGNKLLAAPGSTDRTALDADVAAAPEISSISQLSEWVGRLEGYATVRDADPRDDVSGWNKPLEEFGRIVATLRELNTREASIWNRKLDDARAGIEALRASPGKSRLPWINKNRDSIQRACQSLAHSLNTDIGSARAAASASREAFVAQEKAGERIVKDEAGGTIINDLWRRHRDRLLASLTLDAKSIRKIKQELSDIATSYARLDESFPRFNGQAFSAPLAVRELLASRRAATMAKLPVASSDPESLKSLRQEYEAEKTRIESVVTTLKDANAADEAGKASEADASYQKALSLLGEDRLLKEAVWNDQLEQREALGDVIAMNRDQLLELLKTSTSAEPRCVAAWARLDHPSLITAWPTTLEDFKTEESAQRLLGDTVSDVERLEVLTRRFETLISRLGKEAMPEAVLKFHELRTAHGLSEASLPAWFRFNILYDRLLKVSLDETAIALAIDQFKQGSTALGPQTLPDSKAQTLIQHFNRPMPKEELIVTPGPTSDGRRRWIKREGKDGNIVTFQLTKEDDSTLLLEFKRVETPDKRLRPFYMMTTEVSVEMFVEVAKTDNAFGDIMRASDENHAKRAQTWRWDSNRGVVGNRDWVTRSEVHHPPASGKIDEYPIQAMAPEAAAYFAQQLGCRLPTSAEWTRALEIYGTEIAQASPEGPIGWKLRDQYWKREMDDPLPGRFRLDDGIFLPKNLEIGARSRGQTWEQLLSEGRTASQSEPLLARDNPRLRDYQYLKDANVMFRRVRLASVDGIPLRTGFHDLVGNVAEFVFDDPSALEASGDVMTVSALSNTLREHGARLKVIGGSAFSPPQILWHQAYPVSEESARSGFSDVGFRLVYTDPQPPLFTWWERGTRSTGYLVGSTYSVVQQ